MAVLRPLAVEAAIVARAALDTMMQGLVDTVADDYAPRRLPEEKAIFVPCREGRSLLSFVKRRSISKKRSAGRLAGHNGGKNVTFFDD